VATGVNGAWSAYRQCAATSAFYKSQLELFTKVSLWLGIAGAVMGTVGQLLSRNPNSVATKALGIAGSLAVALAGLAATQAISGDKEKLWIRCRSAGESLKSAVYLYSASVPPFDGSNRGVALAQCLERALRDLDRIALRPGKSDKPPPGPLNVTGYIAARVDDQIDYYTRSANKYQKKADFWRYCAMAGAATSAALAVVSAMFSLSPWVALLATVTTSITAYVKNHRYELTIGLYQATAMRLQSLKDQWLDSGKTDADKADRDSLIQRSEETLALENGAWVAQWSQQPAQPEEAGRP
jgi:SMODS and SLOG-associating 2TM effector domain 1